MLVDKPKARDNSLLDRSPTRTESKSKAYRPESKINTGDLIKVLQEGREKRTTLRNFNAYSLG